VVKIFVFLGLEQNWTFFKGLVSLLGSKKPGPQGQVRDRWLCLGVLCLKSQIPSTKLQINLKLQITNSKLVQRAAQVLAPRERLFFCLGF
jgi:hypothetical protein